MASDRKKKQGVLSGRVYFLAMLCQTLSLNTLLFLPHRAVTNGALGHTIAIGFTYIVIGLPLMFMEYVVAQFTGRDCLEVWHARPCVSHFGYIHIFCQILMILYHHAMSSFVFHYFLITFQPTIPYYVCGWWSKPNCHIIKYNHTVNEDCVKRKVPLAFCRDIATTYPEFHFWRFNVLRLDTGVFNYLWHITIPCLVLSIAVMLTYLWRMRSWKWTLHFVTLFPIASRLVFFTGSMMQRGIVTKFDESIDIDFAVFNARFDFAACVAETLFTLNVGTGIGFNLGSRAKFRSPCYANNVITVIITTFMTMIGIASVAMMSCPYASYFNINPIRFLNYHIANIFEEVPRLLFNYTHTRFWLLLSFLYITVASESMVILIYTSFIEMRAKRSQVIRSPAIRSMVTGLILFVTTFPMLGNWTLYYLVDIKNVMNILTIFMLMIECFVFVVWYGMTRFLEDIHFMQGIPLKGIFKFFWLVASITIVYVFFMRMSYLYATRNISISNLVGFWILFAVLLLSVLMTIVKLSVAIYNKQLKEALRLDRSWGPRKDILRRSRTMFTAQAMTKEYIYRQYHLQAGILARQQRSNVRAQVVEL